MIATAAGEFSTESLWKTIAAGENTSMSFPQVQKAEPRR